jgi:hypothetical protein
MCVKFLQENLTYGLAGFAWTEFCSRDGQTQRFVYLPFLEFDDPIRRSVWRSVQWILPQNE